VDDITNGFSRLGKQDPEAAYRLVVDILAGIKQQVAL
jgi:hypothetical protein